jgi:deazaflavin-dependent oxidoreductase (nitroreductase family)
MPGQRVMLTGATGFVGGHTMAALIRSGHDVTALVRDEQRLRDVATALDVAMPDHVVGDMADGDAVRAALDGADSAIHCAAIVSIDQRRADEMVQRNLEGTRSVLRSALDAGCRQVVHTSSTSALFRPGVGRLSVDMPVTTSTVAYGRSKAACETEARRLQGEGAPLAIVYPSGILGPPAASAFGETAEQMARFVAAGIMPTRRASLSIIDVRDLAALNVALVESGVGAERVMCGGHLLDMEALAEILRGLTGRRFPVPPVPPAALRAAGLAVDAVGRAVPLHSPVGRESMTLVTRWAGTDDSMLERLGVRLRDPRDTMAVSLAAWLDAGMVSSRQAGRPVEAGGPPRGLRLPGWAMASRPLRWLGPRVFPPAHRLVLRATRGRTMLDSRAQPMLLLTTTGAKSGLPRETPLATVPRSGGTHLVVGSNFAQASHPAWTSNLLANPEATIRFHGITQPVTARLLVGHERESCWREALRWYPGWDRYRDATEREFRLFELVPSERSGS